MYLKSLVISNGNNVVRDIRFNYGLNIIVDNTSTDADSTSTGNNVGKTTVLKLVYFCFGGKPDSIYKDEESGGNVLKIVKDYLVNNNILITLTLSDDLDNTNSKEVIIKRSFGKPRILSVNGEACAVGEFETKVRDALYPNITSGKPTIKQLVGHNIRYKEKSLANTLHFLDTFTSNEEYEVLYLCMLGVNSFNAEQSLSLNDSIKKEQQYLNRLQKEGTVSQYRTRLAYDINKIKELTEEKEKLHINDNYENDLDRVGILKETIGQLLSKKLNYKIKKDLIESSLGELDSELQNVDLEEMRSFYDEMVILNPSIQKTFEEMLEFHNRMVENKKAFISRDLPQINAALDEIDGDINELVEEQKELTARINSSVSAEAVKSLEIELYSCYEDKGKCEEMIQVIEQQEAVVNGLKQKLNELTNSLYTTEKQQEIQNKVNDFNICFSNVSKKLYGEKYFVNVELKADNKTGKNYYYFSTFNDNIGTGKKQGEILSFDLAYIEYAKNNNIPAMFFLLNDKKELMHDNQLIAALEYLETVKSQLIVSMLRDKLPTRLNNDKYFALELSPQDKLFRIENQVEEHK